MDYYEYKASSCRALAAWTFSAAWNGPGPADISVSKIPKEHPSSVYRATKLSHEKKTHGVELSCVYPEQRNLQTEAPCTAAEAAWEHFLHEIHGLIHN